jgi:putative RNA 2'-phosphotransferase
LGTLRAGEVVPQRKEDKIHREQAMSRDRISDASKKLSWLLRHGAPSEGVAMDAAGWVAVEDALRVARMTRSELERVVAENNKSRLELVGDRVRACQGHSREGMPVTLEALEASWEVHTGTASVWHGTHRGAAAGIGREGILPGERTHVHLAEELDSRVGKRANVDMMIEVSPARLLDEGLRVYKSSNGVLLCRRVPVSCIVGVAALSAAAKSSEAAIRAELGLG